VSLGYSSRLENREQEPTFATLSNNAALARLDQTRNGNWQPLNGDRLRVGWGERCEVGRGNNGDWLGDGGSC
jgi:hypothetical protein